MTEESLVNLYTKFVGRAPLRYEELPGSGSHRRYFRLFRDEGSTIIGVIGTDVRENRAFISICNHFRSKGLTVPAVLAVSDDWMCYLQTDLGRVCLFDAVARGRERGVYSQDEEALLLKTMSRLPAIQFRGGDGLDWDVCYPQREFDARMINFDLNYFKYCFLKATGLEFDETLLQDDFDLLREDLLQECGNTFMYRDFQARNVMLCEGCVAFGPSFCDVAMEFYSSQTGSIYSPQ